MNKVLLIGNDINNIHNSTNWEELLRCISDYCGNSINITSEKPFPLLYEEICLKGLRSGNITEVELKLKIAEIINKIEPNEIHDELLSLDVNDSITTNYDYGLQKSIIGNQSIDILKNKGAIRETKYSLYRHNQIKDKRFWHIHGEVNVPMSITLGFEHYGGQLQQLRNYTVSGTNYKSTKTNNKSFHHRLKDNSVINESWIDLFFQEEVHILGLELGYFETDLWWLLTNRARYQYENRKMFKNRIIYYCPKSFEKIHKTAIMEANNIEVQFIDLQGKDFYKEVVKRIKSS